VERPVRATGVEPGNAGPPGYAIKGKRNLAVQIVENVLKAPDEAAARAGMAGLAHRVGAGAWGTSEAPGSLGGGAAGDVAGFLAAQGV